MNRQKRSLIILTSTFPRWDDDSVPQFVYEFAQRNIALFDRVIVLAPGHAESKRVESMDGIEVHRFRYWFTKKGQNITYGSGALDQLQFSPYYLLKVIGYGIAMFFSLLRLSRSIDNVVVNAHWLIPQGFIAVLAGFVTKKRTVITIHGGDVFSFNGFLFSRLKHFALKNADKVVVNSSATLAACKRIYNRSDYENVPMGVDMSQFALHKKTTQSQEFRVLFVGRLTEGKGVMYLLKAIHKIHQQGAMRIRLDVVGSGAEETKIKKYIQDNGLKHNVIMHGWVSKDKLPTFYKQADVFVGPSIVADNGWQEAFGLVFVESLATKTPVITTNTGGIKDIILDKKTGLIVNEKSVDELVLAIQALYEDESLRHDLAERGYKHVRANFSWTAVIEKYKNLL